MFHQLTTISNHTSTVPKARYCILILLIMILSSSPASPHNFLYQVRKGDLFTTFIPTSISQNTTSNYCNFLLTLSTCFLVIAPIHNTNSRGQKCSDLSSNISKTSDPSPPTLNKVEFWSPWQETSPFLATTLLGGGSGGEPSDEPKANHKIVNRSRVLKVIIRTYFLLHVFKAFNADSTCIFTIWECALRELKWDFLKTSQNMTFFKPFFFFKYCLSTHILGRIAWPISSYW